MADSYLNIVSFLLVTLFYYIALKPSLNIDTLADQEKYKKYLNNHNLYLAIYLLLVIIVQFVVNASLITNMCGGNITDNIGSAGLITIFPWLLIFGTVIVILIVYPGFKSAFSDVIGYYFVSYSANRVLTTLLLDQDLEKQLDSSSVSENEKERMRDAADTIIKICGNTSIIINQIVPSNFLSYWKRLNPLMKEQYRDLTSINPPKQIIDPTAPPLPVPTEPSAPPFEQMKGGGLTSNIQQQLLDLVITRDNIGESMWFIYTGLLLTSFVQLMIVSNGCKNNAQTMEKNHQIFLEKQEADRSETEKTTGTVYTINN